MAAQGSYLVVHGSDFIAQGSDLAAQGPYMAYMQYVQHLAGLVGDPSAEGIRIFEGNVLVLGPTSRYQTTC